MTDDLRDALADGDPEKVAALIRAGADIHSQSEHGYDALLYAVFGSGVLRDPRLISLLRLLIDNGVSVRGKSTYGESAVRVLSRLGRFDAVQFLLQAGADPDDVELTPLLKAVAFGTLADVEAMIGQGVDLEERDFWERTAWLLAIQTGDICKAALLLEHGARRDARGRCGRPPLFYAIENGHLPMLEWLLAQGEDVRQTDEFGETALIKAVEVDNLEAIDILLRAGADVHQKSGTTGPLWHARTREIILRLLDAGADPQEVTSESTRAILGYPSEPDAELLRVSGKEFRRHWTRRFGIQNPERMNNPFWEGMIRSGLNAYLAAVRIKGERNFGRDREPIWCADRFGQSLTFLPDGRIVQVAGEHEDDSDPDFCIYNDVFVHDPDGTITIYGYPEAVFTPTDFHTATLMGDSIYLIGSLGYPDSRKYGTTPVCRLDTRSFLMEPLITTGDNPGWIYKHRAQRASVKDIQITDGLVLTTADGSEHSAENAAVFTLDIETLVWTKA